MEEFPDGLGFRGVISAATAKAIPADFQPNLHKGPFLNPKYFSLTSSVHKSGLGGSRRHRRCLARQNHGFVKRYEKGWRKMGWEQAHRVQDYLVRALEGQAKFLIQLVYDVLQSMSNLFHSPRKEGWMEHMLNYCWEVQGVLHVESHR